jgi:hypothetical protein
MNALDIAALAAAYLFVGVLVTRVALTVDPSERSVVSTVCSMIAFWPIVLVAGIFYVLARLAGGKFDD